MLDSRATVQAAGVEIFAHALGGLGLESDNEVYGLGTSHSHFGSYAFRGGADAPMVSHFKLRVTGDYLNSTITPTSGPDETPSHYRSGWASRTIFRFIWMAFAGAKADGLSCRLRPGRAGAACCRRLRQHATGSSGSISNNWRKLPEILLQAKESSEKLSVESPATGLQDAGSQSRSSSATAATGTPPWRFASR